MWQGAKDGALVEHCDTTLSQNTNKWVFFFQKHCAQILQRILCFIIKFFYQHKKNNHQTASSPLTNPPLTAG